MMEFVTSPPFAVGFTLGIVIGLVLAGVLVLLATRPADVQGGGY